jgi:hypothetical protein
MRLFFIVLLPFCIYSCQEPARKNSNQISVTHSQIIDKPYDKIIDSIRITKKKFFVKYPSLAALNKKSSIDEISDFWVSIIGDELYDKWKNTPWDYNGTADRPNQGAIACGYFVTTILRDMDLKINRSKLAVCASSVMMKSLVPHQKIKNLSYLNYSDFNNELKYYGKGVYIIGLDFHTGFIVNDGIENWFIHSYFVKRRGVVKEAVSNSWALRSSKTRWIISLTNDKEFLYKWMRG